MSERLFTIRPSDVSGIIYAGCNDCCVSDSPRVNGRPYAGTNLVNIDGVFLCNEMTVRLGDGSLPLCLVMRSRMEDKTELVKFLEGQRSTKFILNHEI